MLHLEALFKCSQNTHIRIYILLRLDTIVFNFFFVYRKFCGLPVAETFDDLFGSMPNSTVYRYASIYELVKSITNLLTLD